jgi:hypothetical protein
MQDSIRPTRLTSLPRTRLLALATLVSVVVVAGCGGSSGSPTTAESTTATRAAATSSSSSSTAGGSGPLAFAKCMRANGVLNFPDPQPGRGALFDSSGLDPSSPAFQGAQAKCQKLMGGGPPGPGSTTHPSAQTLAKLRKIAVCMRAHGISEFPDPRTSVPSNPLGSGYNEITDFDGAILLFPTTLNLQAPAYKQDLATCGGPPLGLAH